MEENQACHFAVLGIADNKARRALFTASDVLKTSAMSGARVTITGDLPV